MAISLITNGEAGSSVRTSLNQAIAALNLLVGHDAQTAVAGAATSTKPNVLVTSEGLTAGTSYTLTLTDALIASTSIIQCTVWPSTGVATGIQITGITPGPGSATIAVAMAALTGTVKFMISIFN